MSKNHSITIRLSDKTYNRIENIRHQLIKRGYPVDDDLTDSFIVREAIITLDDKIKYFIYDFEKKDLK